MVELTEANNFHQKLRCSYREKNRFMKYALSKYQKISGMSAAVVLWNRSKHPEWISYFDKK